MAMTLRPTDGLVSRLLQQQTRSQPTSTTPALSSDNKNDQVTISNQARDQANQFKQQDLESQLLRLYNHRSREG